MSRVLTKGVAYPPLIKLGGDNDATRQRRGRWESQNQKALVAGHSSGGCRVSPTNEGDGSLTPASGASGPVISTGGAGSAAPAALGFSSQSLQPPPGPNAPPANHWAIYETYYFRWKGSWELMRVHHCTGR